MKIVRCPLVNLMDPVKNTIGVDLCPSVVKGGSSGECFHQNRAAQSGVQRQPGVAHLADEARCRAISRMICPSQTPISRSRQSVSSPAQSFLIRTILPGCTVSRPETRLAGRKCLPFLHWYRGTHSYLGETLHPPGFPANPPLPMDTHFLSNMVNPRRFFESAAPFPDEKARKGQSKWIRSRGGLWLAEAGSDSDK